MSKIKNDGLDHYGTEPIEQQQFETAGVEGVKPVLSSENNALVDSRQPLGAGCWMISVTLLRH